MQKLAGSLFVLLFVMVSSVQAAMPTSDNWDDGKRHNWRRNTAWTEVSVADSGGHPGGYLLSASNPGGNPSRTIGAATEEDRYTGNYTAAKIGRLAFDLNLLSGSFQWICLRLRYHDSTYNGWYYSLPIEKMPLGRWLHYEVVFDPNWSDAQAKAAGWNQESSGASFRDTMSDVYTMEIRLLSPDVNSTKLGIDNFAIFSSGTNATSTPKGDLTDIQNKFTGWWYNKNEQGTGLALEIQGKRLFATWFIFDEEGETSWYTTGGNMTSDTTYQGDVFKWKGWPWGQAYQQPVREKVGTTTLNLDQGAEDTVTYTGISNNVTESKTLTSFMADFAPGDKDPRNLTGWWYDPNYEGMGFFIDARGGKMAMVWYNYRNDKSSRWWTSSGPFSSNATTYTGVLDGWKNGQCFACPYQQPELVEGEGGNITMEFIDSVHATVTVNGTTLNIERFNIPAF